MAAAKKTPKTRVKSPVPSQTKNEPAKAEAPEEKQTATAVVPRWRRWFETAARALARSSLLEVLLIATLAMARYMPNSDFSYPSEIVLDIMLLGFIASVFYYLFRLILRRVLPAHVAALLLAYGLFNYTSGYPRLHKFTNGLVPHGATPFTQAALTVLLFAVVFGLLGFALTLALKRSRTLRSLPLLPLLAFVIGFIFITQLGKMGLRMWDIRHFLAYKAPAVHLQQSKTQPTTKPNVYYLLFDRYANDTTLKNIYNYDNKPLLNFLSDQGFVNRQDAYANYPFTMMSVSSTLSMNYHTGLNQQFGNQAKDFQAAFPYRQLLDHPVVAQALQQKGYNYNQVSSWWDFTRKIPGADDEPTNSYRLRLFGKTFWLSDLQRDIVNRSVLSPFLLKGVTIGHTAIIKYDLDRNPVENFNAQMAAVKAIAKGSATEQKPQFTFAHILSPHDPYVFDAEGNTPTYDDDRNDNGVDETVKYTNQLTYLNTRIKDLITTIRTQDPHAVIVIQADEGPYPKQFRGTLTPSHIYDPIDLPTAQMRQKFGVLASYYMPGVDNQTVTANVNSSVNAFRFVLNHYAGYDVPQLPDCQFAVGDKFHLYNYQLVSGQLKGIAQPAECQPLK